MKLKFLAAFCVFLGVAIYPLMEIFVPLHGSWTYCQENHTWQNFDVGILGWLTGIFLGVVIFVFSEIGSDL